ESYFYRNKQKVPWRRFDAFKILKAKNSTVHNLYDYAIVLTKQDLQDRKYLKIPTFQIYNCLLKSSDPSPFQMRKNKIIGVGRLSEDKNFADFLRIVKSNEQHLSTWNVEIYG